MNFVIQSTFKKENTLNLSLLLFAISFAALFHNVAIGLNAAILLSGLLVFWLIQKASRFKQFSVWGTATLAFGAIIALAWFGTWDTIFWAFLSMLLLHQKLYFPGGSILLFESKALSNLFAAPVRGLYHSLTHKAENEELKETRLFKILLYVIVPICFLLFFATIYKNLNPLFENLYVRFFNAIDLNLFVLLFLGAFFGFALFKPLINEKLFALDSMLYNTFQQDRASNPNAETEKRWAFFFLRCSILCWVFF